jgi:tRNA uridine 5-carboxymethylaminomethyl modification enzyme
LTSLGSSPLKQKVKIEKVLTRPKVTIGGLTGCSEELNHELENIPEEFLEQAEIQIKYAGYIRKERELAEKMMRLDEIIIPVNFDFENIKALSSEAREKLTKIRPKSLGQASRISGVSPADISILMVYMGR